MIVHHFCRNTCATHHEYYYHHLPKSPESLFHRVIDSLSSFADLPLLVGVSFNKISDVLRSHKVFQ